MSVFNNRYPGVRPFEADQQAIFFGRKDDTERVLALLTVERLCVLYGKSGHGKSSLLNAGVIPGLPEKGIKTKRRYIPITIRFNIWTERESLTLYDKIAFQLANAVRDLVPAAIDLPENLPNSLWGAFKRWKQASDTTFILLFDQFEEFFSYPEAQQLAFKEQLAELLYTDYPQFLEDNEGNLTADQEEHLADKIDARALLAIRSDRLSELDRLKDRLPAILNKRHELRALDIEQAREAIIGPAGEGADLPDFGRDEFGSAAFQYDKAALDTILRELTGRKGVEAGRIEAFLLQIVCASIEKKVADQGLREVFTGDLPNFDTVFEDYYQDRINELPQSERMAARRVLEQGLLLIETQTGEGRRLSRDAGELGQAFEVTPDVLQNLERTYLIRREVNSLGGFNYELSHDTLIAPVLKARKEQEAIEEAERFERERLEAEARALEAERQAAEEKLRAEEAERLRKAAEKGQRRARMFAVLASVVALLAVGAFFFAVQQRRLAEQKTRETEKALSSLREANRERDKEEAQRVLVKAEGYLEEARKALNGNFMKDARDNVQKALGELEEYPRNEILQDSLETWKVYVDSLDLLRR